MDGGWSALELELPEALQESALGLLGPDCLGAEVRSSAREATRLTAFFRSSDEARSAARRLAELLRGAGVAGHADRARLRAVPDRRWAERYQAALRPFPVGRRFLVDPTGKRAGGGGRSVIALVPGGAFGTGEHATTRLCLEALERHVRPGGRWIDVGCGSGILAVAACLCGAVEVLALDIDAEAARVARATADRNAVADRVRVARAGPEAARGSWDGVVANITGPFFRESAAALARRLAPGGRLIGSGFLVEQTGPVCDALLRERLVAEDDSRREEWGAVVFRKPRARGASGEG
jgi:ribosomal protein L11 methyltransferase